MQTSTSCQSCSREDIFTGAVFYQIGQEIFRGFDPERHRPEQKGQKVKVHKIVGDIVYFNWFDDNSYAGQISVKEMTACGRYFPCRSHLN